MHCMSIINSQIHCQNFYQQTRIVNVAKPFYYIVRHKDKISYTILKINKD